MNYPIFTVYVTYDQQQVREHQVHFIQTLLEAGYEPLICTKGPVSREHLKTLTGLIYYDDLESVVCSDFDVSRRPLCVQEYRKVMSREDLDLVKLYMADPMKAELFYRDDLNRLIEGGCFSLPPKLKPKVTTEWLGGHIICE